MTSTTADRLEQAHEFDIIVTRWGDHAPQWGDTRTWRETPPRRMEQGGAIVTLRARIEPGTTEEQICRRHPVVVTDDRGKVIAEGHAEVSGVLLSPRGGPVGRWSYLELRGLAEIIERAAVQVEIPIPSAWRRGA